MKLISLQYCAVFKYRRDITILIVLLWCNIVLISVFLIDLLSSHFSWNFFCILIAKWINTQDTNNFYQRMHIRILSEILQHTTFGTLSTDTDINIAFFIYLCRRMCSVVIKFPQDHLIMDRFYGSGSKYRSLICFYQTQIENSPWKATSTTKEALEVNFKYTSKYEGTF